MTQAILIFAAVALLWAMVTGSLLVSVWAIFWRGKNLDPAGMAVSAVLVAAILVGAIAVGFAAYDIVVGFSELQQWQRAFGNGNVPFFDEVPLPGFRSPAQFRSLVGHNLAQTLIGSVVIFLATWLLIRATRPRSQE